MKRILMGLLILLASIPILGSFVYLYKKSQSKPTVFKTEAAQTTDIRKKTVATGSVVPRQSVDVKPKITGVISELDVGPGKLVKKGDQLGKVEIIPDAQTVNAAESVVRTSQITADNAKRELEREESLYKQKVVAEAELFKFRTDYALARAQADQAGSNLQLVREGQTHGQGKSSTLIVAATVDGMVIDVPVKVGYSVIQANSFNPGTTVATIANMGDMIFDGHVDESEVAKIKEGMKLQIKVGAIEKETFEGKLEYIAPQGKEIDGAIQFEIKAAITQKLNQYIRAGYSANADIVLDEKPKVLAIREALVQYDKDIKDKSNKDAKDKPFVEVETSPQTFARREVKLGLSDGINVEILAGVTASDRIKIPENAGPAAPDMPPGKGSGKSEKPASRK